jgi:hypothetical protein
MKYGLFTGRALFFLMNASQARIISSPIPVMQNLWQLVEQEDTDHDRTTPFTIRDPQGAPVRVVTNECQLSILLQELKHAEDQHVSQINLIVVDHPVQMGINPPCERRPVLR